MDHGAVPLVKVADGDGFRIAGAEQRNRQRAEAAGQPASAARPNGAGHRVHAAMERDNPPILKP
jgi:hypothetical protein